MATSLKEKWTEICYIPLKKKKKKKNQPYSYILLMGEGLDKYIYKENL